MPVIARPDVNCQRARLGGPGQLELGFVNAELGSQARDASRVALRGAGRAPPSCGARPSHTSSLDTSVGIPATMPTEKADSHGETTRPAPGNPPKWRPDEGTSAEVSRSSGG